MARRGLAIGAALAAVIVIIIGAIAFFTREGDREQDARSDWYLCLLDKEDGTWIGIPPGSGQDTVEKDAIVFGLPTSQRFINSSMTDKNDPGTPQFIVGQDSTFRQVYMESEARLYINLAENPCDFADTHMIRNIPETVLNDAERIDKFGFNVRTRQDAIAYFGYDPAPQATDRQVIAMVPWFKWFNENIFPAMEAAGRPMLQQHSWAHYQFDLPVNADGYGVLPPIDENTPCEENLDNSDDDSADTEAAPANEASDEADSNEPVAEVSADDEACEREPSEGIAEDVLAEDYSINTTSILNDLADGEYFCGNTRPAISVDSSGEPATETENLEACEPITMDIIDIYAAPGYEDAVTTRAEQIRMRQESEDNFRQAEFIRDQTASELAEQDALNDQTLEQAAQEDTQAETIRAQELRHQQELEALEEEFGGVSPEVYSAQEAAEVASITDQAAAEKLMLPCTLVEATGEACALILATLQGQYPDYVQAPAYGYPGFPSPQATPNTTTPVPSTDE